ncbi:MAG: thioredoxin family protein [Deltaproteobacteria bacterium]|nr:thioredoxin family protein [Deltaproteobacteria bacterium]
MARTSLLVLIALLCTAADAGDDDVLLDPPPAPAPYVAYDPSLDGQRQFDDAVAAGVASHKRVLVMLGGNWCKWCRALDEAIASDPAVKAELARGWIFVHVDIGTNRALDKQLGKPSKHGFPVVVVVGPRGEVLKTAPNGTFEMGNNTVAHDPKKVLAFLLEHRLKD